MSYYRTCPRCGANLPPGKVCDCWGLADTILDARKTFPECFAGKTDQEIISELAKTIRRAQKSGLLEGGVRV